ncbi:sugar phosphate isomerase/epimerase family protein [Chloroflexota bacterium]
MPTIALSTGSLHTYGLARVFDLAAAAGFDAIELMVDHRWDSRHPEYLKKLSSDTGLPIAVVHTPFVPYVPGWPDDPVGRVRESAGLARALESTVVVAHLPLRIRVAKLEFFGWRARPLLFPLPLPTTLHYDRFLAEELARFEASEGVFVGVENMPCKRFLGRRVDICRSNTLDALVTMPHVTLDTTHIGTWGMDLLSVYERLKERIVHVHLSNFNGMEHQRVEDGHLPLAEFLARLTQDGYNGTVSVELNPVSLEAEDEGRALAHLHRAAEFCRLHTEG